MTRRDRADLRSQQRLLEGSSRQERKVMNQEDIRAAAGPGGPIPDLAANVLYFGDDAQTARLASPRLPVEP